jgi:hypothetical protein
VFQTHGFALDFHRMELDDKRGIWIANDEKLFPARADRHTQLFGKLPAGGILYRFSCLEFAARELPKATMAFVGRALTHEKFAVALDHGGHYTYFFVLFVYAHERPDRNQAW